MTIQWPWVSRRELHLCSASLNEAHENLVRLRKQHIEEIADLRAFYRAELDRASIRLGLSSDIAMAMAKQAQAALESGRCALRDAVEMARAASQTLHGPSIPDEIPASDSIAEIDRRVARERRAAQDKET